MWVLGTVTRHGWAGGGHHLRVMRLTAPPGPAPSAPSLQGLHLHSCTIQAVPSQPSGEPGGGQPIRGLAQPGLWAGIGNLSTIPNSPGSWHRQQGPWGPFGHGCSLGDAGHLLSSFSPGLHLGQGAGWERAGPGHLPLQRDFCPERVRQASGCGRLGPGPD